MRHFKTAFHGILGAFLLTLVSSAGFAQQSRVMNTVHNLSVTGPGEIKSLTEKRVCRFCHIPHNAVSPIALWSQQLSKAEYVTPSLRLGGKAGQPAPQPDGSSRLCLSCHDGTVAMGGSSPGMGPKAMTGSRYLRPSHRGFVGTDLSGSHPISFVVPDGISGDPDATTDMGIRTLSEIRSHGKVRLDQSGKMQCTSCHDPHQDSFYKDGAVPRFWVAPTVQEVCLACHVLR